MRGKVLGALEGVPGARVGHLVPEVWAQVWLWSGLEAGSPSPALWGPCPEGGPVSVSSEGGLFLCLCSAQLAPGHTAPGHTALLLDPGKDRLRGGSLRDGVTTLAGPVCLRQQVVTGGFLEESWGLRAELAQPGEGTWASRAA